MSLRINTSVVLQTIDGKLIGFNTETSLLYTFNETAEYIFKKIKLGWEEDKIVAALAKKYEVALPTLKKDVKEIIKNMIKNKILYSTLSK